MTDVHDPEVRSYNMSRIRSKNTKPEIILRKALFKKGYRYRLHKKDLPGKPDLVLKKHRSVIFVNGCFWHGHHGCKYFKIPATRTDWWKKKIEKTKKNDLKNYKLLEELGWRVITVWECELKKNKKEETLLSIEAKLAKL